MNKTQFKPDTYGSVALIELDNANLSLSCSDWDQCGARCYRCIEGMLKHYIKIKCTNYDFQDILTMDDLNLLAKISCITELEYLRDEFVVISSYYIDSSYYNGTNAGTKVYPELNEELAHKAISIAETVIEIITEKIK